MAIKIANNENNVLGVLFFHSMVDPFFYNGLFFGGSET